MSASSLFLGAAATDSPSAPADDLHAAAQPQFRTVTTGIGRSGIRVERVFWDSLTDVSQRLGIRRTALVATVVERAKSNDINVASALRSYVAMVFRAEVAGLRKTLAVENITRLQQMAPVPSFALTRQKRLISANPEFVQLLRGISGDPGRTLAPEVAQLSLDRSTEQIFEELRPEGASLRCMLTIRVDDRTRRVRCKIVAVPPPPLQAIVGYLLAD